MKKLLSLCISLIFIPFLISSVSAGEGYTGPIFIPVDGKMCIYKEPVENIPLVYNKGDCLEGSDPETFQKFRKGGFLFGKYGRNIYVDKNAIYYFPMNAEWTRTELNIQGLKKLRGSYMTDGRVYFYNDIGFSEIKTFARVQDGKLMYLGDGMASVGEKIYFKGVLQEGLKASSLEKHNGYYYSGKTLLLSDGWTLHRVDNVDYTSFKKYGDNYEDKNNFYFLEYGHYGFSVKVSPKLNF